MQRRCDRNRSRSKRRSIDCPIHRCSLDSVSQKYPVFADRPEQLQARGVGRRQSKLAIGEKSAVPLSGEWVEAFWCDQCQKTEWYRVRKLDNPTGGRAQYQLFPTQPEVWQRVTGVIPTTGNPSVSEFTQRQSRRLEFGRVNDFSFAQ